MTTVQLPISFLKGLRDNPGYTDVWIRWLVVYGEKLKDPFFMDKLRKEEKLSDAEFEKLNGIYQYGQPYLQALYFGKAKKESKKGRVKAETIREGAERVLTYLNLRITARFGKINKEAALKPIIAILNQGYSPYDCKEVIDKKWQEWNGTDYEQYLTPTTLFNPKKFDTYLNQPKRNAPRTQSAGSHTEQVFDAVREAVKINTEMGRDKTAGPGGQGH